MKNLEIQGSIGTFFTPTVKLNANRCIGEITGESFLEDSQKFYDQIIQWLEQFAREIKKPLIFEFRLTYLNTSSIKAILFVLKTLRKIEQDIGGVTINWYYPNDDFDMLIEAEDLAKGAQVKLNLIPFKLNS